MSDHHVGFVVCVLLAFCSPSRADILPFPGASLPGTNIGGNLSANYEPSGAVWHPTLNSLFVVGDNSRITRMSSTGTIIANWSPSGNWEAVTYAQPSSSFLYLANESSGRISEFNYVTGNIVRSFDVSAWLNGAGNQGMEALTFVPDPKDPEGGLFYAGLQSNGEVFRFSLPIASSTTSTTVTLINSFFPVSGRSDLSDLTYDPLTSSIYAIWDGSNRIRQMTTNGTLIHEWTGLPGDNQEGVAFGNGSLFITEDNASVHRVMRYDNFAAVPEPSSVTLIGSVTIMMAGATWYRRRVGRQKGAV